MQQLQHDQIVNFLGISLDGPNAMLIMEYCAGEPIGAVVLSTRLYD